MIRINTRYPAAPVRSLARHHPGVRPLDGFFLRAATGHDSRIGVDFPGQACVAEYSLLARH